MTTPAERLPRELAALGALIASIPSYERATLLQDALASTEGQLQDALNGLVLAVRAVHVGGKRLMYDCATCEAIRDAERVLQATML